MSEVLAVGEAVDRAERGGGAVDAGAVGGVEGRQGYRRAIPGLATAAAVLSLLHHVDHVLGGSYAG